MKGGAERILAKGKALALDLRDAIPSGATPKSPGQDMIRAMRTGPWRNFLGIRLDSAKAEGQAFKINLMTPDNSERCVVELPNGTLTNIEGFRADDADLPVTIEREDLVSTMMGTIGFDDRIASGNAKLTGSRGER